MSLNCPHCTNLSTEIDKLIEQRHDAIREVALLKKFIQEYKADRAKLSAMLRKSTVRLDICRGRMEGCAEERPGEHAVSLEEIPGWLEEQEELVDELDPPSVEEMDRRCLYMLLGSKVSDALKRQAKKTFQERYGKPIDSPVPACLDVAKCDHGVRLDQECSGPGCSGKLDLSKTRSA